MMVIPIFHSNVNANLLAANVETTNYEVRACLHTTDT